MEKKISAKNIQMKFNKLLKKFKEKKMKKNYISFNCEQDAKQVYRKTEGDKKSILYEAYRQNFKSPVLQIHERK